MEVYQCEIGACKYHSDVSEEHCSAPDAGAMERAFCPHIERHWSRRLDPHVALLAKEAADGVRLGPLVGIADPAEFVAAAAALRSWYRSFPREGEPNFATICEAMQELQRLLVRLAAAMNGELDG